MHGPKLALRAIPLPTVRPRWRPYFVCQACFNYLHSCCELWKIAGIAHSVCHSISPFTPFHAIDTCTVTHVDQLRPIVPLTKPSEAHQVLGFLEKKRSDSLFTVASWYDTDSARRCFHVQVKRSMRHPFAPMDYKEQRQEASIEHGQLTLSKDKKLALCRNESIMKLQT
jgi:hypothetical protein